MTRKRILPLVVLTSAALSFTACAQSERDTGASSTSSTSGGSSSESSPANASGAVFTFGAAGAPKLFDPLYATDGETFRVTRQIFDGLVGITPGTADLAPALAESWESSPDGLTWTFTLKSGVKFTDGEAFNADAACKNFERMFDQNASGEAAAEYWTYTMGAFKSKAAESVYKGCEAKDDTTLVMTLNRFTSAFPAMLALPSFSMQSPKAMTDGDANNVQPAGDGFTFPAYSQNPVGTGPYMLDKYDEANKTVSLKVNPDYWGEAPKNGGIVFKIIPDETTRRQELQAGSIDGYDLPNPVDWKGLTDEGNQVEVRPAFNILYMGLNPTKNDKLKDLKVRQALYYALNRDQLVATQLPEGATVATQFMPDTVAGYNTELKPYAYDPEKAKSLLKEAGAEGMTLTFAYPSEVSRPYMPDPQKLFEALRTDLEAVGVKVNVVTKPWNGGYLDGVSKRSFDAFLLGWTGDYNSADNFLGTFFGSPETNYFATDLQSFGTALADRLVKAAAIVDENARAAEYQKINQEIMETDLPGLAISNSPPAIVVSGKVKGLVASPLTAEEFASVSVG